MAEDTMPSPPSSDAEAAAVDSERVVDLSIPRDHALPDDVSEGEVADSEERIFGMPVAAFVYGGTHTSGHDNMVAEREADAERRRDEALHDKRAADQFGIHRGNPNDVATLYTDPMTDHPEVMKAYVPLQYLVKNGRDVHFEGVGDIVMPQDPAFDNELMLMIFCPQCKESGLPAGQAILQIRQSNRRWELDTRTAGEMFVWEGQALRSAGKVMGGEAFTCAQCNWRARVDDNKVIQL